MKIEKFSDVLQGMDINTEDTIVTLSDKIWKLGHINEIKKQVSDTAFTFQIVANVIGSYKGDGWQSIIEDHAELLPYISQAMFNVGLSNVGEATKNIVDIFPSNLDVFSLNSKEFCEVVNFLKGIQFNTTIENLKEYSEDEQEKMSGQYFDTIHKLDDVAAQMWAFGCPDNEGWGMVSKYLEENLQGSFWK